MRAAVHGMRKRSVNMLFGVSISIVYSIAMTTEESYVCHQCITQRPKPQLQVILE